MEGENLFASRLLPSLRDPLLRAALGADGIWGGC
jgi:hypothetical protein